MIVGFFADEWPMRPLRELIDVYHNTVGRNCKLVLDMPIDRAGLVAASHTHLFRQLGDFVRECYNSPLEGNFSCTDSGNGNGECILELSPLSVIDRVLIQEDLTFGQSIRQWDMDAKWNLADCPGCWWGVAPSGQAIGHKRIAMMGEAISVQQVRLNVRSAVNGIHIKKFQAFNCQSSI